MQFQTVTCERCGNPQGDGGFCDNCGVLSADAGAGLYAAPGSRRLVARLLDLLLFAVTGGIGWWMWLSTSAANGQSPAKRMLGLRVVRADGQPMDAGAVWFREGVLGLLLVPLLPLSLLWALRSPARQSLTGLLSGGVVVQAETRPIAGHERRREARTGLVRPEPVEGRERGRRVEMPPPPATRPARSSAPATTSKRGGSTRSPGPVRSQAPETSGSTSRPRGRHTHPTSQRPPRAGSTGRPPQPPDPAHPTPGELNWPAPGSARPDSPGGRREDQALSDDRPLSNDKPMWPGGVPPWQRSGERAPGSPPAASRPPARPPGPPPRNMPPAPPRQPGSRGVSYSPRAHTSMEKIAELEALFRSGQVDRDTFENERRRLIAES